VLQICIRRIIRDEGFTWTWTVQGGHQGTALAVLERIRVQLCNLLNAPDALPPAPSGWNAWEPAGDDGEKVCIGYEPATQGVDVSIRGFTSMEVLEGLIDVSTTIADQWFSRVPTEERELVALEAPLNGHV
jgi:hypothetical protein